MPCHRFRVSSATDRELERARGAKLLRDNLPLYARECLHIRTKGMEVSPFRFNASQLYLHERLEEQKRRTGKVRMLVLKGRQVGISTYIAARFYHRTTHTRGARSFILTHEDRATDNLFDIVHRYHERCPPEVKPQTGTASAKELSFSLLDSGYKVGTAGSKSVGRSDTIQLFHGSEMAFWPNAEEHSAGIGEAIANMPGTEDIRESTANGIGGSFHALWKKAEVGDTEFECCFIPWFMHEEYSTEPPKGWAAPPAFIEYGEIYQLKPGQLYWAWLKNREKAAHTGGESDEFSWQFKQEYPANADEAFQTSGANHFIKPEVVLRARKRKVPGIGPIVLGVDPARGGNDMMGIIDRQRRRLGGHICERYKTSRDPRANAGHIVQIVKRLKSQNLPIKKVVVDTTDGNAMFSYLEDTLGDLVVGVNFGEQAHDRENYANRRAEMWDQLRQWFDDPVGVQCPDKDDFQGDMTCTSWGSGLTHKRPNGQLVLEQKEKIRERLKFSPDLGDAAALCFAIDYSELTETQDSAGSGNNLGSAGWLV